MGTIILLRHGRSTSNGAGILAGRTAGVELDQRGAAQAAEIPDRLAQCPVTRVVSSPIARCRATLAPLAAARGLTVEIDERLTEIDYGEWTGRTLADLASEPLWETVQQRPSAMIFPGGESLADAARRGAAAAREIGAATPAGEVSVVCSHGDVIKAILADALGMPFDAFQRIMVAPASLSVVHQGEGVTAVEKLNDAGTIGAIATGTARTEPGVATLGGETGDNG